MNDSTSSTPESATPAGATPATMRADIDAHASLDGVTVQIGTQEFHVRPMKVRQVFPFLALARPMLAALANRPSSPPPGLPPAAAGPDQGGSSTETSGADVLLDSDTLRAIGDADWMLTLLEVHGPQIIKALAVGVDCDQAKIDDLEVVDVITLVKHFVAVNASFLKARGLSLPPGLLSGQASDDDLPPQASS